MKKILKGKVKLIEQEGGWCSPIIEINGEYLENILLKFPHIKFPHKVITDQIDTYDTTLTGEYKITIERLEIK